MRFERLNPRKHNRKSFDCGIEALNTYLQQIANQDQKRSLSQTYVLSDGKQIIGYYTISAHSVLRDNLPDKIKLGRYDDIPFLLLGRLAVDKQFQGQGFGDSLIFHAFKTTWEAAQKIGILGMVVEAKNDKAISFYEGFGFIPLRGTQNRLVLPLSIISQFIEE